ncbi:mechanosensitive ion channel family protein [bacterium]|nr:mechanosensitive ion channel family protein [bacterium]
MIDEILAYTDKLGKLFSTFKVSMILGIIINIVIIAVLFKLTEIFMRKLQDKFNSGENAATFSHVIPIFEKIIKFLIVFILAASFLQSQGYSLTSLIAGFGITGLAVGFAAQQTIASMFGTIAILTDKVYKNGDYIKVNNTEGTVESINLRSTKIRTIDNFLVTVPNDIMADSIVENISQAHKRRMDMVFGVTYDTSDEKLQRAIDIVKEVVNSRSDIGKDAYVTIQTLDSSSINIRLIGYAKTKAYDVLMKVKSEIYFEVVKRYRAEGIEFAFPSTTVYMAKDN